MRHGDSARGGRLGKLAVDEVIVKVDGCGIHLGVCKVDLFEARPVDGCQAHGARLAAGVDHGAGEIKVSDVRAGRTNRAHLCMRSWVIASGHLVGALADHHAVLHNHGAERSTRARGNIGVREFNRPFHVLLVLSVFHRSFRSAEQRSAQHETGGVACTLR